MHTAPAPVPPIPGFRPSWTGLIDTGQYPSFEASVEQSARSIRIGTAEVSSQELQDEFRLALWVFTEAGLRLVARKPVTVHVSRGEELWFAENRQLDIYATGETATEAIDQFASHLVNFYRHYKSLETERALGEALKLKRIYEESFVEASE